jgi:tetratricopeptide (TPR) repeat protein
MPEDNAATQRAPKPQGGAAKPGDDASKPQGGAANSQDGSVMSSALFNLMIAEQYIDATSRLPEHRLVCFHYAVALLAAGRDDPAQRARARDYFRIALCWQATADQKPETRGSIDRIVCESHYNLGVIYELDEDYESAQESYQSAIDIAEQYPSKDANVPAGNFDNVALLAGLGSISSATADITSRWKKIKNRKDVSPGENNTDELGTSIKKTKTDIDELKQKIATLEKIVPIPGQRSKPASPPPPKKGSFLSQLLRVLPQKAPETSTAPKPKAVVLRGEILDKIKDKLDDFNGELESVEVEIDRLKKDPNAFDSAPESIESQLELIERLQENIESDLEVIELEMDRFKRAPDSIKSAPKSTESAAESAKSGLEFIERLRKNIESGLESIRLELIIKSGLNAQSSRQPGAKRRIRRAKNPTPGRTAAEAAAPEGETETES